MESASTRIALDVTEDGWFERVKENSAKFNAEYRPIYNRVFIMPVKGSEKSGGGIILTDDARKANQPPLGYLVNYGDTADIRARKSLGKMVMYAKRAGITVHTNALRNTTASGKGEVECLICEDRDVIQHCIGFEDIPVSELGIPRMTSAGIVNSTDELNSEYLSYYKDEI